MIGLAWPLSALAACFGLSGICPQNGVYGSTVSLIKHFVRKSAQFSIVRMFSNQKMQGFGPYHCLVQIKYSSTLGSPHLKYRIRNSPCHLPGQPEEGSSLGAIYSRRSHSSPIVHEAILPDPSPNTWWVRLFSRDLPFSCEIMGS